MAEQAANLSGRDKRQDPDAEDDGKQSVLIPQEKELSIEGQTSKARKLIKNLS